MRHTARIRSVIARLRAQCLCAVIAGLTAFTGLGYSPPSAAELPRAIAANVAAGPSVAIAGQWRFATAAPASTSSPAAGRTRGTFGVSNSGAVTYTLPLKTPPGIGAVELDLALVYNSRSGSGVLGVGWSLSGLSVISRCNKSWSQDGLAAGVTNTVADRFCLDGQQLKLVSGTYGLAGSVYATEIETFARIIANGTAGNGPRSFTVTTRNGLIYEYGTSADARVHAGTTDTVRSWALSRVRDRTGAGTGNSIAIAYANDAAAGAYTNGSFRVATISYPTSATGQGPFYRVQFGYSARPAADVPAGYLSGFAVHEPHQLDSITIESVASGAMIKSYNLAYASAPATGRIRLTAIQECAPTSCLQPTTVTYQDGANGWQASPVDTAISTSAQKAPLPLELNGDGLTDILYAVDASGGNVRWHVLLGTPGGYTAPIDTGFVTSSSATIIPGQFVGNGRTQFLVPQAGYWHVAGFTNTGLSSSNTGRAVGGEYAAGDFDGDGLADLMARSGGLTPTINVRRNVTVPTAGTVSAQFASSSQSVWTVPSPRQSMPWDNLRVADLNGDGRADIVALTFTTSTRNPKFFATPLLSNGFGAAFTIGTEQTLWQESMVTMGDWNADGCSDIIQVRSVFISNCAGNLVESATGSTPATGSSLYTAMPADWNGDGRTDLLYVDAASKQWFVVPSTGSGAAVPVSTGIAAPASTAWFVFDADGDGLADLGLRDGNHGQRLKYHVHAAPGIAADLAARFTDGFGMFQHATYASIARSNHTRHTDAVFPEADFQAPLQVADQFTASDGRGATYQNQFHYYGARVHLQGRGFEGFESQRITDSRNGLITFDHVQRQFPYTGTHVQRRVLQPNGSTRISQWLASIASQRTGGTGFEQRWFPYLASTQDKRFEFGGTLNGSLIAESNSSFAYADGYGNPTLVQTSTTDKDPYSPFFNSTWQSSLANSYANDASTNWCIGLPSSSIATTTAPGQPTAIRTTSYAADPVACRITQQVIEPNAPALKVATNYGFDGCGNVSSVRVVGSTPGGSPMPERTTAFDYGTRCQMLESVTNALGHRTAFDYRYELGVPTRVTDPNGLATTWLHDEFGRRVQETRPDQTQTAWSFESCANAPCWGTQDLRFVTYEWQIAADGTLIRHRYVLLDGFERLRFDEFHRVFGTWTNVSYDYDSLGRRTTEFRPFSTVYNGHTAWTYDALNRVTAERTYDSNGALRGATGSSFAGRTSRHTDVLGRTRSTVTDVTGRLRRVIDPAPGGTTQFDYDSSGNLKRIQDSIGATSSGTYNARGFRTQWSDADGGTWNYSGNSLNELVAWSDANGQSFTANYDLLGRLVSRTEPEGTSTWTWGNKAPARNIGRLQSMSGLGYGESLGYDSAGRLAARTITTDQSYRYDFAYNPGGEIESITYPASPVPTGKTASRFKIRYGYSYGAPYLIEDVTDTQHRTLWSLAAANDYSSAIAETLGGGAISRTAAYDTATNELISLQAGTGGTPGSSQSLSYQWDAAGNLVHRRDANQGLTEAFTIDNLDRVTGASLNGTPNLSVAYDASGNVTHKSDVGTYTYGDPAHPHGVTAAGGISLAYDRNGNVTSRDGMSQQWASFNLPTSLQKSGYLSQLSYGPDHRRWRQVATYQNGTETTHYVGGHLEKESTTSSGLTYWRHYVPTPSGDGIVVSRNSNASSSTTFVLADHLGGSDTLLDESGAVKSRLSYSAFGARRGSNWSATTAPDWLGIANSTRRGYTSHEMLDNVGIVHMNGRVYDPQLGRFLSTDPIIGNLGDSQSVNAYAYVGNRPLVTTDPSGLVPADGGIVSYPVVAAIFRTAVNYMGHHAALPPPPATALPGQSAQSGVGLCGPGTFSPTCGGVILYAGVPSAGGALPPEELYALENLEQFFVDLGMNTVDVLILSPIRDAETAVVAASHGDFGTAAMYGGFTACGAVHTCKAIQAPFKAVSRARISARRALRASDENTELVQRAMSRAELDATRATGLVRGGRSGIHYVSDAVNSRASRARERLALPTTPDVRVTMQVPRGTFSAPSTVGPLRMPDGRVLTGGGLERTAIGDVPAAVIRVDDL